MVPLIIFLGVFVGALYTGAWLAYPLYLLLSLFTDNIDYADVIITSTQLCGLTFSLLYLKYTVSLSLETVGLKIPGAEYLPQTLSGFLIGMSIMALLGLGLMSFGIYGLHPARETSIFILARLFIAALLTGFAVALFEETVFRGALLAGLQKKAGAAVGIISVSIIYAAVHFIHYEDPSPTATIDWLTAPGQFLAAYSRLITADTLDAFLSLWMLGLLLGLIRIRTGNIIQCIGVHAGLVAGIKLFRFFTAYNPGSRYDFLVSSYDHRLGYIALLLLALATVMYYFHACHRAEATHV